MFRLKVDSIFKNQNFLLLWMGQLISLLGDQLHALAAMWYVHQVTGSAMKMGITLAFGTLPAVLVSPFAGYAADRWSRKTIVILSDLVNGCLICLLTGLLFFDRLELWMLYGITALISMSSSFFGPAISATLPTIVNKEELVKINSVMQFTKNLTGIFGPVLAGTLVAVLDVPGLFLLNGVSFLLSAFTETFISIPVLDAANTVKRSMKSDILDGVRYTIKNKALLHLIIVGGFIINFFLAPLTMQVLVLSENLNLGSKGYGFLLSCIGIGSVLISLAVPAISKKLHYYALTCIGLTCEGGFLLLLAFSVNLFTASAALALFGASVCLCNISLSTLFQALIPNEMMGRVSSSLGIIARVTVPLGMFIGGFLIEKVPVTVVLVTTGIIVAAAGLSTVGMASKQGREAGQSGEEAAV